MMLVLGRYVDVLDRVAHMLERSPDSPELNILYGNAKARMPFSWATIQQFDEAFRSGRDYDVVRTSLLTPRPPDDDRLAEIAFRRALKARPDMPDADRCAGGAGAREAGGER
jgi:hypothetical protein